MELSDARQLAFELMARHGVLRAGWRFAWSNGKRQLGAAQIGRRRDRLTGRVVETKTIKLSRHLVRLNGEDEVRDTILHEIAHALAGVENGHNRVWKAVCRRIGARPERLAGEGVAVVRGRYAVVCGCCERLLGRRHRRMNPERLGRTYCRYCGVASKGRIRVEAAGEEGKGDGVAGMGV